MKGAPLAVPPFAVEKHPGAGREEQFHRCFGSTTIVALLGASDSLTGGRLVGTAGSRRRFKFSRRRHQPRTARTLAAMRLDIARCSVDYKGRLDTHPPTAVRLLLVKSNGSFSIHSEFGFRPLNWMNPPNK